MVQAATRHTFHGGANDPESYYWRGYYLDYRNGKELVTEHVNMSGQTDSSAAPAVRQVTQWWQQRPCVFPEVCPDMIAIFPASPVDARVWNSEQKWVNTGETGWTELGFDEYNNVTSTKEYGFGGSLLRQTLTSWVKSGTVASTSWDYVRIPARGTTPNTFSGDHNKVVHIRDLPLEREVLEGSSTVSKSKFTMTGTHWKLLRELGSGMGLLCLQPGGM